MSIIQNKLSEKINPTFFQVYLSDKPNKLLKGGRSGTKSSAISQMLVEKMHRYPQANVICFRQKANSLRMSVYNQIVWALQDAGVSNEYKFRNNPMTILHKRTNTGFYFMGMDDPQKVKGIKIENGYLTDLWFEEADALRDHSEIDTVQDTFIREDLPNGELVNTWISYNPPRNQYHWINDWSEMLRYDDNWLVHHSTYLDDLRGYNSPQIIKKIENYKKHDYEYYRWQYLGEIIGLGSNVYNADTIQLIEELPDDPIVDVCLASDTGHQTSATAVSAFGITAGGKVILLDTYYYEPAGKRLKKAPSELSEDIFNFEQSLDYHIYKRTIDSAEGALRNQYRKDYNIGWHPVAKQKKHIMIDYTHDLLAQGRFYILNNDNNQVFLEQLRRYEWDEDTVTDDNPKPLKVDDHCCDVFQYFVTDNLRRLNLKR